MTIKKSKFILSSFIALTTTIATSSISLADDSEYQDKVYEVYEKYSENKEKVNKDNNSKDQKLEEADESNAKINEGLNNKGSEGSVNSSLSENSNNETEENDLNNEDSNLDNKNSEINSNNISDEIESTNIDKIEDDNSNQKENNDENELDLSPEVNAASFRSVSSYQSRSYRSANNYINTYNTKDEFLTMLQSHANLAKQYNIFPEVMMGQAILESGWGQSKLSKQSKNIFGVKVPNNEKGQGKGDLYDTYEYINGKYVKVKAEFRRFNTYEESIRQYLQLLSGPYYSRYGVSSAIDYKEQVQRIKNAGYATAHNYVSSVLNVIDKSVLPKYNQSQTSASTYSRLAKKSYPKNSWVNKGNDRYYTDPNGNFIGDGIYKIGSNKYYFTNGGKLKTNTKIITNIGAYIIKSNGIMSPIINRWLRVNSDDYHTDSQGKLNKGIFVIENKVYSFDSVLGKLEKNKIFKENNYIYASDSSGAINKRSNTRTVIGNYEYSTDSNGKIVKSLDLTRKPEVKILTSYLSNGKAYNKFSDNTVQLARNTWVNVAGKDFRTDSNGSVLYGIHKIGNHYYHLTYNGISKGYKVYVNKHLYSFDNNGKGYLVSSNYTPVRDLDVAIGWMKQAMNFNYEYSMDWQKRNQIGYADCSSAVYRAMKHGGFISKNTPNGNTETLFELGRRAEILKQISENEIRYGDIFVAGVPGKSLGAGGHTGFILDRNRIIHCNYADYGVSITQRKGRMGDTKYPVRYYRLVGAR